MRLPFFAASDEALYLGPPKAQVAGESHHGTSMFPPSPTTFQGMVRTRVLLHGLQRPVDLRDRRRVAELIGPPECLPACWHIDGPWVAGVVEEQGRARLWPWVQLPWAAGEHVGGLRWCATWPVGGVVFDRPTLPLLVDRGAGKGGGGWISAETLWELLSRGRTTGRQAKEPPFVARESRSGLELNDASRTAKESMLYFREARRLSGGVWVDEQAKRTRAVLRAGLAATLELPDQAGVRPDVFRSGVAALGRRRRPLTLEPMPLPVDAWSDVVEGRHLSDLAAFPDDKRYAWLILASPAPLDPSGSDGEAGRPRLDVPGVEVVAAAVPDPLVVGGLDRVDHRPKPNRAFLAAGSSWLLRLTDSDPRARQRALRALHHRCSVGSTAERSFGCGRTWVSSPLLLESSS